MLDFAKLVCLTLGRFMFGFIFSPLFLDLVDFLDVAFFCVFCVEIVLLGFRLFTRGLFAFEVLRVSFPLSF